MSRIYDTAAWKNLRRVVLKRDGYRCVRCHLYVGGKGMARVDHIEPVTTTPQRALDPSNLRTLCAACDNSSHSEKRSALPYRIDKIKLGNDARGLPRDAGHPWNAPGQFRGGAQNFREGPREQALGALESQRFPVSIHEQNQIDATLKR